MISGLIRPGHTRARTCKDDCGESAASLHVFYLFLKQLLEKGGNIMSKLMKETIHAKGIEIEIPRSLGTSA